jgi:hypothetical protein
VDVVDKFGTPVHVTYAPGYKRGGGDIRLLNPYLGETFATLDEAKAWVSEEEHDRYAAIVYFEVRPIEAAPQEAAYG